jgi:iron complex transport system ATP-binding protein
MKLEICNATCGYAATRIVEGLSLKIESSEIVCLLGPNGSGKTTLFKTILGFLKLQKGSISLNDVNIRNWSREQLARAFGYVPQSHTPPFPFKVIDVVLMGRTARIGSFSVPGRGDIIIAHQAMETLGIFSLRNRIYTELSGGERQLVLIARAIAQEPALLIMDEPTSNLDFGNQVRVLTQIKRLAQQGQAVLMTSHVPDHALRCATKVAVLSRNGLLAVGRPEEILTQKCLRELYDVEVDVLSLPAVNGLTTKICVPNYN